LRRNTGRRRAWRKPHKEGLFNMHSSPNIISMTKSRRMRWVEHVENMAENSKYVKPIGRKPEGQ
jgi:hypothetical protein